MAVKTTGALDEINSAKIPAPTTGLGDTRKRRTRLGFFRNQSAMKWVALQMLTGDRAKYLGLIFTIAFSSFLIAQQLSIFARLMDRARSRIVDVRDADIWVMDPATQYFDE